MTDKLLFLLAKEHQFGSKIKFYSFYPYSFGPFSELFYYDLRKLDKDGYISNENLTNTGRAEAQNIDPMLAATMDQTASQFKTEKTLIDYVYSKYPDYTVNSKLVKKPNKKTSQAFFTIGYEGKDIDRFLDILIHNEIQIVIDVRNNPFSMNFAFIKNKLESYLKKVNIEYIHFPELGIPGKLRKNLDTAEDYESLFKLYNTDIFNEPNFKKILDTAKNKRAVLLCMEQDVQNCHRSVLSSKLENLNFQVTHL